MVRRKGEMTNAAIDRGWPHQVAVEARLCRGEQYMTKYFFASELGVCERGHAFRRNDTDYVVYCFAERAHAELFMAKFGGTLYDPKTRPKWGGKN